MDKDSFQWESDEKNFDERDVKDFKLSTKISLE
jgi:hypothetical protein